MNWPNQQMPPAGRTQSAARKRFVRLMQLMLLLTLLVLGAGLGWLHASGTPMPLHFVLAVAVAVIGSMMLATALMGLVFFSHASGADQAPEQLDTPER